MNIYLASSTFFNIGQNLKTFQSLYIRTPACAAEALRQVWAAAAFELPTANVGEMSDYNWFL